MYCRAKQFFELFYSKFYYTNEFGCWIWTGRNKTGTKNKGKDYGQIMIKGRKILVHRLTYLLFKGDPKEGFVCHKCDIPACINPEHLFLGTQSDNMRDREIKGRANHPRGDAHLNSKLTQAQALAILNDARKHDCIAKEFNVSVYHVRNIKYRTKWKQLREQELTMANKKPAAKTDGESDMMGYGSKKDASKSSSKSSAKPAKKIAAKSSKPMKKASRRG